MNHNWSVAIGLALAPFAVRVASAQGLAWRLAGEHRVNICQMAFDLARNRFITVSEPNSTEPALLTAEWNGSTWQTRTTATTPPPRTGFALTYDLVRSRIVMFGGRPPYGTGPQAAMNDLWVYDGVDWVDVSPAVRPPARHSPAIAYDPGRSEVVIAGGLTQSDVPQTDTWAWNGASWRQVPSPLPPFQTAAMALFWPSLRLVLLGNTSASASETWEYDGIAWSRRVVPSPVAANYRMTSDLGLGRIAMLAAQSAMLWEWDGATWTPSQAALDGRRDSGFAMNASGRALVRGGRRMVPVGALFATAPETDTWQIDQGTVIRVDEGGPGATAENQVAYDSARGRVVSMGMNVDTTVAPTWEFDGASWHAAAISGGAPGLGARLCFDPVRQRTVRFGGQRSAGLLAPRTILAETTEWDGVSWTQRTLAEPPARSYHAMTFDSARGVVLLFGGNGTSTLLGDTWAFDGTAWTLRAQTGPPPRSAHALAFDRLRGRAVLFGGQNGSTASSYLSDTWEWDGTTWTHLFPPTSPAARRLPVLAFDGPLRACVLLGGLSPTATLRDQWLWDGVNWTQAATGTADLGNAWFAAVPTGDQWFYLTADESWVGAATVANAQPAGVGCGGNLVPALRTAGDPVLGSSTFAVELHRAATNAPFLLGLGAGTAAAPIGAGCTIYLPQLDDSRFGIAGPTGRAVVGLPVPGAPQLLGLTVSLQAAALDATAPLGFALSNAIVAHVGL